MNPIDPAIVKAAGVRHGQYSLVGTKVYRRFGGNYSVTEIETHLAEMRKMQDCVRPTDDPNIQNFEIPHRLSVNEVWQRIRDAARNHDALRRQFVPGDPIKVSAGAGGSAGTGIPVYGEAPGSDYTRAGAINCGTTDLMDAYTTAAMLGTGAVVVNKDGSKELVSTEDLYADIVEQAFKPRPKRIDYMVMVQTAYPSKVDSRVKWYNTCYRARAYSEVEAIAQAYECLEKVYPLTTFGEIVSIYPL